MNVFGFKFFLSLLLLSGGAKMYPKSVDHLFCRFLGLVAFLPNLMPLLSCHQTWPEGCLSGSLFI